jgi:hypothetical protein
MHRDSIAFRSMSEQDEPSRSQYGLTCYQKRKRDDTARRVFAIAFPDYAHVSSEIGLRGIPGNPQVQTDGQPLITKFVVHLIPMVLLFLIADLSVSLALHADR